MIDLHQYSSGEIRPEVAQKLATSILRSTIRDWYAIARKDWISNILDNSNYKRSDKDGWNFDQALEALEQFWDNDLASSLILRFDSVDHKFAKLHEAQRESLNSLVSWNFYAAVRNSGISLEESELKYYPEPMDVVFYPHKIALNQNLFFQLAIYDWIHTFSNDDFPLQLDDYIIHMVFKFSGVRTNCRCTTNPDYFGERFMTSSSVERFISSAPGSDVDILESAKPTEGWGDAFENYCAYYF